jgi:hypothetical protein
MWSKKKTKKAYDKCLANFVFTYAINYNGEVYKYDDVTGQMRINPIPIIVELRRYEGKQKDKLKIRELKQYIVKDLKKSKFMFRNGTNYDVANLMSPIATLLGVLYGLNKLQERL